MFWTRVTADIVIALYFAAVVARIHLGCWTGVARMGWFAAWLGLCGHLLTAYGEVHGWSHLAAWEHTRLETLRITGWDSGAGLWFNFVTLWVWTAEAIRIGWCHAPRCAGISAVFATACQVWIAFMMFQSAVVFAEGLVRWLSLAGAVTILAVAVRRRRGSA